MNGINTRKLSILAAAVGLALGSTATFAQQSVEEQAENVESAERRLESAEDRAESAAREVEQREEQLDAAESRAERAADARDTDDERERPLSSDRRDASSADWSELTKEHEGLSHFMEALEETGLSSTLMSGTAYTVFVPTNEAFEDRWEDLRDADDREELIELLRAHIVADDVDAERVRTLDRALTVDGGMVDISEEDGELMVGGAKVVDEEIRAGNVRIYAIDDVLDVNPAEAATAAVRDAEREIEREIDEDRPLRRDRDLDD